jgi:3'-5' exoribonuclease
MKTLTELLTPLCQNDPDFEICANFILQKPEFSTWSGSGKPIHHHYGKGGLLKHTTEVVNLILETNELLDIKLDPKELALSALYHDIGKLHDYACTNEEKDIWAKVEHSRIIHHISKSAIYWSKQIDKTSEKFRNQYHDKILHNILSHHGQREWGSPVTPKGKPAWLLHLCDNISARMEDADRLEPTP